MTTQPPQQPPRDPWGDVGYGDGFGQPAPRSIRRLRADVDWMNDQPPAPATDETPPEQFGDLGQFGITSDELPAIHPNAQWENERWAAEQRIRAQSRNCVDDLYRRGFLTGPVYDLLWQEFDRGYTPVIKLLNRHGLYRVWIERHQRWYPRHEFERLAYDVYQASLPINHPDRETAVIALRPWPPQLDSGFPGAPTPRMRATPPLGQGGMGAPTPHTRPLPPEWRREPHRKPWEE